MSITTRKLMAVILTVIQIIAICKPIEVFADEKASENNIYYIDAEEYNAGDNSGYSKKKTINSKDPHYGWKLGQFVMTGFTSHEEDKDGNQVFLKTVGDDLTLSFDLQQDITKLNGDEKKYIVVDKKGYDQEFGTPKTNFGKGTLFIRYTDPNNKASEPQIYTNFLTGESENAENMTVILHEEGVYEVALDYKVEEPAFIVKSHDSYRMSFKFTVQNGNDMGFLRENGTGKELKNCSITENGFYIDLANSKYLNVQVKREELNSSGTELITDTRANKVATDGESFTSEGIYTITVRNEYVDEPTTKTIYVGDDALLKAYVASGRPLAEIQEELDNGATVTKDGTIIQASVNNVETEIEEVTDENKLETSLGELNMEDFVKNKIVLIGMAALLSIVVLIFIAVKMSKRAKRKKEKKDKRKNRKTEDERENIQNKEK